MALQATPGNYPGTGQATLLNPNNSYFAWQGQRIPVSTASIAFQLARQKSAAYPFGAAFEVSFSGVPGTFEVDVQAAEIDQDANYCNIGTGLTLVNASNAARYDCVNLFPKFVRFYLKTLTNDVLITALVTR